jgi:multicomponent Na+:H+ antiporter subunit B
MSTMHSLILRTAGNFLLPLLLLFSIFLLLRGHDEPGGGFIGGLVAASAIVLNLFALEIKSAKAVLWVDPRHVLGIGMTLAVLSAIPAVFMGEPFFTAQWLIFDVPAMGELKVGTVLLFDIGVYLVVIGAVLTIMLSLAEAED